MALPNLAENLQDPITMHMRQDFTCLQSHQTVGEALAAIRQKPPEGRIIYFYVVDENQRLQGVVPTRRLLLNPLDKSVADIMVRQVVAIPRRATVLEACEFFTLHRLLAFPVVDEEKRLVGIIDVELYTQELNALEPQAGPEDLFQLIGVHLTQAQQMSPLASFRGRFPWLICNLAGGILAALLSGIYQDVLGWNQAVLALFIPVVLALAESVAIQSVSLTLEIMRVQRPSWPAFLRKLRIESLTGLFLGIASALAVAITALAWQGQWKVALCLLGGIAGGVTSAAAMGLALPYLLHLLKRNPQVASGPVALTSADLVTLLFFFNLARMLVPS